LAGEPIQKYRQYHRPIVSPEHIESTRFIAADSIGKAMPSQTGCRGKSKRLNKSAQPDCDHFSTADTALGLSPDIE
jgi:hypothetical protein